MHNCHPEHLRTGMASIKSTKVINSRKSTRKKVGRHDIISCMHTAPVFGTIVMTRPKTVDELPYNLRNNMKDILFQILIVDDLNGNKYGNFFAQFERQQNGK